MAGAEKVGGGPTQVNGLSRAEESARNVPARRNSRAAFDERVGLESNAPDTKGRAAEYLTAEKWLRERTVEELKTLVEAIQSGATDPWQLTFLIFYAAHPEMKGQPLTDR